jgi:peroxiredoxin
MSIEVGADAPDFSLRGTQSADPVSLSSFRGEKNVVLLFFPLAFTSVCTTEMCGIRDSYSEYEGLDAVVLGVSVDSPFALQAWAKEQGFSFPLLSDFNRDAATAYGALYEDLLGLKGVAKRAAFVIDRGGVVRYAEVLEKASELPNFDAVRETLSTLS